MKVLLLGDASNYHATLAIGLAALGHDVTLASNGSQWMQTHRQIDLSRATNRLGGAWLWIKLNTLLQRDLRGYDIVQICTPGFVELRPERLRQLFDKISRHNGSVSMTMLAHDSLFVRECTKGNPPIYTEFKVDGSPTPYMHKHQQVIDQWLADPLASYCQYVYDKVDSVITCLYDYQVICSNYVPAEKLAYGGIPIELPANVPPRSRDGKVRILAACHAGRQDEKGMQLMLPVLQRLAEQNPDKIVFDYVSNVPLVEFKRVLDAADIVVDQMYAYTPATTALMAMARNKITVSGAEPEYYDFINEPELRPIVNVDPRNVEKLGSDLQLLVDNPDLLLEKSMQGRQFVEKHNEATIVAQRFINTWQRTLDCK